MAALSQEGQTNIFTARILQTTDGSLNFYVENLTEFTEMNKN